MNEIRAMFLRQSMLDCEEAFRQSIARRDTPAWDWLVITAANEAQAAAYRAQIEQRLAAGLLPTQTRYAVIPDPGGKRVGSGGATLNVLHEIALVEGGEDAFARMRILVLHSGGDSQRIPQYSACGKLFARVPRALADGRPSTLFDEFCISLSCVPARMNGGMLLMSGDVLLLFNALQIDFERSGAACLSIKAPVQTGTRHGVFLSDGNGGVCKFLHKQDEATLRALSAVNAQDMVDIDTGAVWLDGTRVSALFGLIRGGRQAFDRFVNERVRLSLYGDFVYPMASDATLESYLTEAAEGVQSAELQEVRKAVWKAIGGTKLSLISLAPAEFIHFGTTAEWRSLLLEGEDKYGFLRWRRAVMSDGVPDGCAAVNSLIESDAPLGPGSVIEDSRIGPSATIGAGCVVSGAELNEALPDDAVLHVLPIDGGNAYCARLYGVHDNPKEAKRFGEPIDGPLWDAPLHPVARTARDAIHAALTDGAADRRMSLRESFAAVDMERVLDAQARLTDDIRARQIVSALSSGRTVDEALKLLPVGIAGDRLQESLRYAAEGSPFPLKHRLFYTLARAAESADTRKAETLDHSCWRAINNHLLANTRREVGERPSPRFARDKAKVTLPVRVNWGGGWSDTPPYCLEHGGTVLNVAVLLGGKRPVRAVAERISEPVIRIISDDLGMSRDYTQMDELVTGNPGDPHALCKAALSVCGVTRDGGNLRALLNEMGGGMMLRTSVDGVPKGSGLGTSSILGAAMVRALSRLLGQPDDDDRVASLTLCMEQLMSTGGGWQDQVGGLFPGVKLTSSRPGTPQRLAWRRIPIAADAFEELSARHALVFTGQRRLARDILREIMGKVVAGNPETMEVLSEIRRLAVLMAFELEMGDIDRFARLMREHWALSKRLDAGSSNTCIDHLIAVVDDLIDAAMICGAGGGGFISMILKKDVPRAQLSERLEAVFQESGVKVWDAELER